MVPVPRSARWQTGSRLEVTALAPASPAARHKSPARHLGADLDSSIASVVSRLSPCSCKNERRVHRLGCRCSAGELRAGRYHLGPVVPLPGTERTRRFRPKLRWELIGCGLHGHELVGTDAAEVRPEDHLVVREDRRPAVVQMPQM